MPLDITKLFVLFSANLFYHWNLCWSSVIRHCSKIEISSFNVCFALAVVLSDIVGALIVRVDGFFFPLEKLQSDCRNKYNWMVSLERNKMYTADFELISVQKGHHLHITCVSESGPISTIQNGCSGSAVGE